MNRHATLALPLVVMLVAAIAVGCSDDGQRVVGPAHYASTDTVREGPKSADPGVVILRGYAADSSLRAQARSQSARGDNRLAAYLDTSETWRAKDRRGLRAFGSRTLSSLPTVLPDLTGEGTPPNLITIDYFPPPVIISSQTYPGISGSTATFATSQVNVGATNGESDLTYSVTTPNGGPLYTERTETYSEIADGVLDCITAIYSNLGAPNCALWGSVTGSASVTVGQACDFMATASGTHHAWIFLPIPTLSFGNGGKWGISFGFVHGKDAAPVGNARNSVSAPPCEPTKEKRRIVADGGGSGGQWIVDMQERQIRTDCYALQDRTVQSDGSVGDWVTVGVECISSFASIASSGEPTGERRIGVPFTLAGVSTLSGGGRAEIVRRGKGSRAEGKVDVITLPIDQATPDDLEDAISQFVARANAARSFNDVVESVGNANRGKGAGHQKNSYEKLLAELRKAQRSDVAGVGNAATIPVIVIP